MEDLLLEDLLLDKLAGFDFFDLPDFFCPASNESGLNERPSAEIKTKTHRTPKNRIIGLDDLGFISLGRSMTLWKAFGTLFGC